MLSERNECPALFLDLGEAFRGVLLKAEAEIGRCKETFLSGTVSKQYSIFGLEGLVARKTRMGHQKDFILQGGLK